VSNAPRSDSLAAISPSRSTVAQKTVEKSPACAIAPASVVGLMFSMTFEIPLAASFRPFCRFSSSFISLFIASASLVSIARERSTPYFAA
jgi:TctA family transporter